MTDLSDSCFVAAHEALRSVSDVFREEYERLPRSRELAQLLSSALSTASGDLVSEGFAEFAVRISVRHSVVPRALTRNHCLVIPLAAQEYSLLSYFEPAESANGHIKFEPFFGIVTSFKVRLNRTLLLGLRQPIQIGRRLLQDQLKSRRWWLIEVIASRQGFAKPEGFSLPFPVGMKVPQGATPRGEFGVAYDAYGNKRELGKSESKLLFDGPLAPLYRGNTLPRASDIEGILRSVAPLKGVPPRRWPPSEQLRKGRRGGAKGRQAT